MLKLLLDEFFIIEGSREGSFFHIRSWIWDPMLGISPSNFRAQVLEEFNSMSTEEVFQFSHISIGYKLREIGCSPCSSENSEWMAI